MSEGGAGAPFGFAPQGPQHRKASDDAVRVPDVDRTPPVATHAPASTKAHWTWLLVGVLLGSGGTLVASPLWLQESLSGQTVVMQHEVEPAKDIVADVDDDPSSSGTDQQALVAAIDTDTGEDGILTTGKENGVEVGGASKEATSDGESKEAIEVSPKRPADISPSVDNDVLVTQLETLPIADEKGDAAASLPASADQQETTDNPEAKAVDVINAIAKAVNDPADKPADQAENDVRKTAESEDGPAEIELAKTEAKLKAAPVTQRTRSSSSRRVYRVQLAAVDDEPAAKAYWQDVRTRLPDLFDETQPVFDRRQIDRRVFYRIWVGTFSKRADADDYCQVLKRKGQDCFVTRG